METSQEDKGQKRCTRCGELKPGTTEYFPRHKATRDGLNPSCKVCEKVRQQKWRDNLYTLEGSEKLSKYRLARSQTSRKYRANHPDRVREVQQRYRAIHRERLRIYVQQWRAANPDKTRILKQQWREANRKKVRAMSLQAIHRRRARLYNNGGSHTAEDIQRLYENQKGCCAYCGNILVKGKRKTHIDHVRPLVQGGSNSIENIAIACAKCNLSKGDRTPEEWVNRWYQRSADDKK
jgi:5-methylcytosine-specific restriction endonuclease McrA